MLNIDQIKLIYGSIEHWARVYFQKPTRYVIACKIRKGLYRFNRFQKQILEILSYLKKNTNVLEDPEFQKIINNEHEN